MSSKEQIEKAIELLHEADGLLQQALEDTKLSYAYHTRICDIADDIEMSSLS